MRSCCVCFVHSANGQVESQVPYSCRSIVCFTDQVCFIPNSASLNAFLNLFSRESSAESFIQQPEKVLSSTIGWSLRSLALAIKLPSADYARFPLSPPTRRAALPWKESKEKIPTSWNTARPVPFGSRLSNNGFLMATSVAIRISRKELGQSTLTSMQVREYAKYRSPCSYHSPGGYLLVRCSHPGSIGHFPTLWWCTLQRQHTSTLGKRDDKALFRFLIHLAHLWHGFTRPITAQVEFYTSTSWV